MTYLILFLLGVSTQVIAGPSYVSEAACAASKAGQPYPSYVVKGHCQKMEGDVCYKSVDCAYEAVVDVREGDYEAAVSVEDCADDSACEAALIAKVCPDADYEAYWGDKDSDSDLEVWCVRRSLVKRLKVDSALKAAHDSAVAAKAAAVQDRADAKARAKAADLSGMTLPQLRAVVQDLIDSR